MIKSDELKSLKSSTFTSYANDEDFNLDLTPFEFFGTKEEVFNAVGKSLDENNFDSKKCRRRKPCRVRYCYISSTTGRRECVTTTVYCCVG